jgi:hypothetical protein
LHEYPPEEVAVGQVLEGNACLLLHEAAEVVVAFAGVAEGRSRLMLEGEDVVGLIARVRKSCLVREDHAWRQFIGPGVVLEVGVDPVGGHGLIE